MNKVMAEDEHPTSNEHPKSHGLEILYKIIARNCTSGLYASVFRSEMRTLQHMLLMHGIGSTVNENTHDLQLKLLSHIFRGECIQHAEMYSPQRDRTACIDLSKGFQCPTEISISALDVVLAPEHTDESFPIADMWTIARSLHVHEDVDARNPRRSIKRLLENKRKVFKRLGEERSEDYKLEDIEKMDKTSLTCWALRHQISHSQHAKTEELRNLIMRHISAGKCFQGAKDQGTPDCAGVVSQAISPASNVDLQVHLLTHAVKTFKRVALKRLLDVNGIQCGDEPRKILRQKLRKHISILKKGKMRETRQNEAAQEYEEFLDSKRKLADEWPRMVPKTLKDRLLENFRNLTCKEALSTFTCASCAEETLIQDKRCVDLADFDIKLLHRPDRRLNKEEVVDSEWLDSECTPPSAPFPELSVFNDALVEPRGVSIASSGNISMSFCKACFSSLKHNKTPPLALANHTFLGQVPDELKGLTVVEEAMIARCRSKCWIIQMKQDSQDDETLILPHAQRGMKGHIIVYPQRPSAVSQILPPSIEELTTPICVVFVGSSPPTEEWLKKKAKPLIIRKERVRNALMWLKEHNHFYKDITINHDMLNNMPQEQILPVQIEHILPDDGSNILTSRYDVGPRLSSQDTAPNSLSDQIPFQNVVVTDVDGSAPANELRAAAVRHIKKKGGGYIEIPHDPEPANEFCNPSLFPMIYPCLFPYGIGGFENEHRSSKLSMKRHVKHLFSLSDRRFQEHYSFLFTAFNILQRRSVLLHTSLKVDKCKFQEAANNFASVSPGAVHVVSERVSRGDFSTAKNEEERKVLSLMKQVKLVTSHVQGSSASRLRMRNEIRGLMFDRGLPSFYITINPADVYNPVLKFLAGSEIDVDQLLREDIPKYHEQALLVARNPAVAAKFFNIYMKAFISALLGFDPKQKNLEGGILGVPKAYYGCVEHQGRGTLHCHMMVWLEGGLNPDEIKKRVTVGDDEEFRQRLLAFLDDTISNSIPDDADPGLNVPSSEYHPCSVRALVPPQDSNNSAFEKMRQKDLRNIVEQCQVHKHSGTCYKYWKGPPEPKECRFDLHPDNRRETSSFDSETGELCLRCLDGMVNNFNATILEAIRCNMDIKFIGSGGCAKAVLYYITDYITKQQLKTHVAFAALELAVKKLGEYDPDADQLSVRAKSLLQKCAHALISHQELSAQLVCCYLMDLEDHFTSHRYGNLYWTSLERFIDAQDPMTRTTYNDSDLESFVREQSVGENESISETEHETLLGKNSINQQKNESDNEVGVGVDRTTGELVQKSDQVADYTLRGADLNEVCVWDFVAQVEKFRLTRKKQLLDQDTETNCEPEEDEEFNFDDADETEDNLVDFVDDNEQGFNNMEQDDYENVPNENVANDMFEYSGGVGQIQPLLSVRTRIRPRCELLQGHLEAKTHGLKVLHPDNRIIPVPIGPALPRRDRKDIYERYCRLMLILFKPWRSVNDLRQHGQSWAKAFADYLDVCPENHCAIMNNMQMLHECKDSRDDHFAHRGSQRRDRSKRVSREMMGDTPVDDDFGMGGEEEEQFLLQHISHIASARSRHLATNRDAAKECIEWGNSGGLFNSNRYEAATLGPNDAHSNMSGANDYLEEIWEMQYAERRNIWKKKASGAAVASEIHAPGNARETSLQNSIAMEVDELYYDQMAVDEPPNIPQAEIRQDIPAPNTEINVNLSEMITEYTLNVEQARAFRIIGEHSLKKRPDPLHMYIGGAGGTGKSRVINALKDFFNRRNESRRFRLSSYTGVAARNISGMTLHAALNIGANARGAGRGRSHRDLVTMWDGVDYLFVDEVSMIGCNFLTTISESLCEAKGSTSAFGGVNIIFAGDFAQLPPVNESRLYSHLKTSGMGRIAGQKAVFGKLLWLSIKTVVILTEIMRQSGNENTRFIELLDRLREGKCTQNDFDLLNTRLIKNAKPNWNGPDWQNVPLIVRNNEEKDAINAHAAEAFARQTGRELHWYYAKDNRRGQALEDEELKDALLGLHSGKTKMRLGKLPLVIGMPVMITQNFNVPDGIVNGCNGILKRIRFKVDRQGRRYVTSCVIHAQDTSGKNMHNLPNQHVVSLRDEVDLHFVDPYSHKRMKITRAQVPILPAFAMTAHKAQGRTLDKVIVDLEACSGTESPYVMISRVTSLQGLLILRPFDISKIRSRLSEDRRKEARRLELLQLETIVEYGSDSERAQAIENLTKAGFQRQIGLRENNEQVDVEMSDIDRSDPFRKLERLQQQNEFSIRDPEGSITASHRRRRASGPQGAGGQSGSKRRRVQ